MNVTLNFGNRTWLVVPEGTKIPLSRYVLERATVKLGTVFWVNLKYTFLT